MSSTLYIRIMCKISAWPSAAKIQSLDVNTDMSDAKFHTLSMMMRCLPLLISPSLEPFTALEAPHLQGCTEHVEEEAARKLESR